MEFYEAVRGRRNVHKFKAEKVPEDKLKRIMEAGLQAPSAGNNQPCEFVVITDPEKIKAVAEMKFEDNLQGQIRSGVPRAEAEKTVAGQRDAFNHSVPVALVYDSGKGLAVEAAWSAITSMWMAACAEGLGMSPAYFSPDGQDALKECLGVPEGFVVGAVLRFGVPGVIPDAKPRKALESCLHYNRVGGKK